MVVRNRTVYVVLAFLVAMLMVALVLLAGPAQSQEEAVQQEKKNSVRSQDRISGKLAPDNRQNRQILREAKADLSVAASGDLVDETLVGEDDEEEPIFVVEVTECVVEDGAASIVVEDEDGNLGVLSDGVNDVDITATSDQVEVRSTEGGAVRFIADADFQPAPEPTIVSSAGIECGEESSQEEMPTPEEPPAPEQEEEETELAETTMIEETTAPLPQDDVKGPLEGATAIGDDTNGDIIGEFEGEPVLGIDIIEIAAENCEVTEEDNLTITLDNQGVPGRFIDGQNGDITVDEDGVTIIGQGPENVVEPFLVEEEDEGVELPPNDNFTVVSTTGIGGDGCSEAADLDTTPDTDTTDDVDTNDDLPNTGGGNLPADTRTVLAFVFSGFGLLAFWLLVVRRRA